MIRFNVALLALLLVASCGGEGGEGSETSGRGTTSGAEGSDDEWGEEWDDDVPHVVHREGAIERLGITPPDAPWAEMSREDRELYMVGKVMPIMHELFVRQYGARAEAFGCEGCHGGDMRERSFAMPSTSLFPVPAPGTPAYERLARQMPEGERFMREVVTPTMGTLLGIEGYTCTHCHPSGS